MLSIQMCPYTCKRHIVGMWNNSQHSYTALIHIVFLDRMLHMRSRAFWRSQISIELNGAIFHLQNTYLSKRWRVAFLPERIYVYEIEPAVWGRVGPTRGCSPRSNPDTNVPDLDCLLRYPNVRAGIRLECRNTLSSDIIVNGSGAD